MGPVRSRTLSHPCSFLFGLCLGLGSETTSSSWTKKTQHLHAELETIKCTTFTQSAEKLPYTLPTQFISIELLDIVMHCPRGAGLEAYIRLARTCDSASGGGRRRNLLRLALQAGRCTLDALNPALEGWEEQVRRYERFWNDTGERHSETMTNKHHWRVLVSEEHELFLLAAQSIEI